MEEKHIKKFLTKLYELAGEKEGVEVIIESIRKKDETDTKEKSNIAV